MKTFNTKPADIKRGWYVVDAEGKTLGRLAAGIARVRAATALPVAVGFGISGPEQAAEAGAVESLLVSDSVVRDLAVEQIMHVVEAARGTVVLVSPHHEAGAKLGGLGGIAALLRFPVR